MPSQLAQYGDMALVNHLSGVAVPSVAVSAPTWFPGLYWVNGGVVNTWNGTAWTAAAGERYLALLTSDPVQSGAVNVSDLNELTTAGYARQAVSFSVASTGYPSQASNTDVITFGPMTTTMLVPVQWIALVTSATGNSGYFLASWQLPNPVQVDVSQSMSAGIGSLILQGR